MIIMWLILCAATL